MLQVELLGDGNFDTLLQLESQNVLVQANDLQKRMDEERPLEDPQADHQTYLVELHPFLGDL